MKITDNIFKSIFNESVWISITTCTISLKFIPKGPIDYKSALVQVVAWHRTGEKPLPESMLTQFTDAYIYKNNQDRKIFSLWFSTFCLTSLEFT